MPASDLQALKDVGYYDVPAKEAADRLAVTTTQPPTIPPVTTTQPPTIPPVTTAKPEVTQPWWVGQFANEADANYVDLNRNQQI